MKHVLQFLIVLLCLGMILGCQKLNVQELTQSDQPIEVKQDLPTSIVEYFPNMVAFQEKNQKQEDHSNLKKGKSTHADVFDFGTGQRIGVSNLLRKANHVKINFHATGSSLNVAGHAVTLWFIIEDPSYLPLGFDMKSVDGAVIGANGVVNFNNATVTEGDATGFLFGNALLDAENQSIDLVIRSHGLVNNAYMPDMISSFCGGCYQLLDGAPPACLVCNGNAGFEPDDCVNDLSLSPCQDFAGSQHL